jgi:flagellar biosynthesis/type III secretory pathway protein FliH
MSNPKIIKTTEGGRRRKAKTFVFEDLEGQAKAVMIDARRRAEELIREALDILRATKEVTIAVENRRAKLAKSEQEVEKRARQAEDRGYKEGFEKGRQAGHAEGLKTGRAAAVDAVREEVTAQVRSEISEEISEKTAGLAGTVAEVVGNLEKEADRLRTTARDELISLAVAVAERIVKKEIALDPSIITTNVQKAIEMSIQKSDIEIAVNPADRELLETYVGKITEIFSRVKRVKLVDDESVGIGGCIVRSGGGVVDMKIETQLEEIEKRLLGGDIEGKE